MVFFELRDIPWKHITKSASFFFFGFQGGHCSNCDPLGYFLNLHSSTPEMAEAYSSKMSVSVYKTIRCHNPEHG